MTILFKKDWDKYPSAFPDLNTANKSFIRLAGLYRKMGLDNHAFILALHDKELVGVDPHAGNLSKELITRIAIECKVNYWYYIREVVNIPSVSGVGRIHFKANRGNISTAWLFFNHITSILIQPRQTGKSLSTDVLMRWLTNIGCANTTINLLTKDDSLRHRNLERLKEIEDEFPFYLKLTTRKDVSNTEMFTVKALGNTYLGHVPQASPKAALKVGRGLTSPIFQIDEAPFQNNIEISLPAALAAGGAARDLAEANNEPYGTIITTTAGRLDDPSGRYTYGLLTTAAVWTERLYDSIDLEDLKKLIRTNSSSDSLRINCTFSHRQLGYTDEWLKKKIEESLATGEEAEADFFNKWLSGSAKAPLPKDILKKINNSQQLDYYTEISETGYITRWYISEGQVKNLANREPIILALDTSDAIGSDDIALTIRNTHTGAVIAAGNYNETNLFTFAEWLLSWFIKYPNLVAIIERRSSAVVIIDYLIKMMVSMNIDPFKRIFNWVVDEFEEKPDRYQAITIPLPNRPDNVYVTNRKQFGFATSGSGRASRDKLYGSALLSSAKYTGNVVHDVSLIGQITSLTTRNGRIDHPEGSKDDLCITWLLSYWFLTNARNLKHYGIDPREVLKSVKIDSNKVDPEKQFEQQYQKQLRYEIDVLAEKLKTEKDDYLAMMLERKIRKLTSKLKMGENDIFNIDSLLEDLAVKRRLNKRRK